jgi:Asp-tRNA(Asn)/Glu-tRNA(Gln) amidotransferase A subunit family amidase
LQGYEIWQQHGEWIMQHSPNFANDINERLMWCKNISVQQKDDALQAQTLFVDYISKQFMDYDVIVLPTTPGRAPFIHTPANEIAEYRNELMVFTAIAGLTGLPQLHLPLFTIDAAHCGVSLIGKKGSDLTLLKMARTLLGSQQEQFKQGKT